MTTELKEAFLTFPLMEAESTDRDSNMAIPSEQSVKDVKDWVDFKEM